MGAYTCQFGVVHKTCRCPTPHTIACDKVNEHAPHNEHGTWVHQDSAIHRCIKPEYARGVSRNDRWQCNECNAVWIVEKIDGDQRDGSTWIVWKEYESWKSGPFPPGTK